ncbi:hypothetical protein SmJEL517_g02561 [Synchytrium microbalum]|uniref:CoA-binding domain-containing protein n=1 Tax=Synchytrium microbalum TaxID=1806994 RepID=A0A507C700_9FUNG|nr:uncharacterized protein SmJEL517_g02561 [Synchytrium microbalum]TPX34899.1 hypothetical protein SmJEL517_g02561 [Synchytrium microbalum]
MPVQVTPGMVQFFKNKTFAVVGASTDRSKFGNRILRWYIDHDESVIPINPKTSVIEDVPALKSLSELSDPTTVSVSVITPPPVTKQVLQEAISLGIKNVWLQPGSESEEAVEYGVSHGLNVVVGNHACVLVHGEEAARRARL